MIARFTQLSLKGKQGKAVIEVEAEDILNFGSLFFGAGSTCIVAI